MNNHGPAPDNLKSQHRYLVLLVCSIYGAGYSYRMQFAVSGVDFNIYPGIQVPNENLGNAGETFSG